MVKSGTATRVGEAKVINVKLFQGSVGGKDTFRTVKLNNVNISLSDANSYLVGEGWAGMTASPLEDVSITNTYSIDYEEDSASNVTTKVEGV